MKGQITVVNMIAFVITIFLYLVLLSILEPMIEDTIIYLATTSNPYVDLISAALYLAPFALLLGIILSIFNMAIPKREGH